MDESRKPKEVRPNVPRAKLLEQYSSRGKKRLGRITKAGDP